MREGTGRSVYNQLSANLKLAGKTGTSNDSRDSWFAGFGQDLLGVVWMSQISLGKLVQFVAIDVVAKHILQADRDFFPLLAANA